ncbi:MAG: nickel-binding protein [Desulfosudaceae bacterium]
MKNKKFMAVHHDPNVNCEQLQGNWRQLANVESAKWERTYYNEKEGWRFCLWLADDAEHLKKIFNEIGISWEYIVEVEETVPDLWGEKWAEHVAKERVADTLGN